MVAEELKLVLEDFLNGPLDDGLADLDGHRFDRLIVEVEPWSLVAIGPPGDDFPPPVGHVTQLGRIVGLTSGEWHVEFVLELGERAKLEKSP
jgi:hypothetical protein